MSSVLRNIGGAVRTGLLWSVIWAPMAVLIGAYIIDPDNSMDEMWVLVGAYPGFLCGAIFFTLLRVAEGHTLYELSLPRVAAVGAGSGLLVGAIPYALATPRADLPALAIICSLALLSSISAVGSALVTGRRRR